MVIIAIWVHTVIAIMLQLYIVKICMEYLVTLEPGGFRKEGSAGIILCLAISIKIEYMRVLGNSCCDVVDVGGCLVDIVGEFEVVVLLGLVVGVVD